MFPSWRFLGLQPRLILTLPKVISISWWSFCRFKPGNCSQVTAIFTAIYASFSTARSTCLPGKASRTPIFLNPSTNNAKPFMRHKPEKLLLDITQAAERIEQLTRDISFHEFQSSEVTQLAVERLFEMLGEAMNRLAKLDESLAQRISNYRRIIDFRNLLTHGYDMVDVNIVWDAAVHHLPQLKAEAQVLLNDLKNN